MIFTIIGGIIGAILVCLIADRIDNKRLEILRDLLARKEKDFFCRIYRNTNTPWGGGWVTLPNGKEIHFFFGPVLDHAEFLLGDRATSVTVG